MFHILNLKEFAEKQKQYVSYLGYDYTQHVKTEDDVKDFEELCRLEPLTKRPLKECVEEVVKVLRLDRKLRGSKAKVILQKDARLN